jgi:hypothetical protein
MAASINLWVLGDGDDLDLYPAVLHPARWHSVVGTGIICCRWLYSDSGWADGRLARNCLTFDTIF